MYSSSLNFLAILCSPALVAVVQAWAPAAHPDPTKLPKALEFAEKAWKFPNAKELHYPLAIPSKEEQDRRHPWSSAGEPAANVKDQSLSCMEDGDQYYFDGHTSVSLKWPTRAAFAGTLPKTTDIHLAVADNTRLVGDDEEDCDDFYYDDSGDVLCWVAAATTGTVLEINNNEEEECEHTYFDRIGGEELCWLSFADVPVAAHKEMTQHPGHPEMEEDCEHPYYDDTGDILCWAI